MEIHPDILKKLLCSVCGGYLSCAPIRVKHNGDKLCGRCSDPENEPILRITLYEELAMMVVFPCGYQAYGCRETLYMEEMKDHEEGCQYRQYVCPVADSGQCDWSGSKKAMLDHCTQQHPDNVLQKPFTITHRLNASYYKTFVLATLQILFVVHCKVCTTSKTIYHSVRLIGKSALASNYIYKFKILKNGDKLVMTRDVIPQGCKALQKDASVQVDFQTMLRFLSDFQDVTFQLTVSRKCVKCSKCVTEVVWPPGEGWCCKDCAPAGRRCEFLAKGCTYTDADDKVHLHELHYCAYASYCFVCGHDVSGSLQTHYYSTHSNVAYKIGANWRTEVVDFEKYALICSDVGMLYCCYYAPGTKFMFYIISPLRTEQLSKYRCMIQFTNSDTGYTVRKTPRLYYTANWDWGLEFDKGELMCDRKGQIDIKIDLMEI